MHKLWLILFLSLSACGGVSEKFAIIGNTQNNKEGKTIQERFSLPEGYQRITSDSTSFAFYLQHLPLKPAGSLVKYYNGSEKTKDVYEAVVDQPIRNKDLQQCADAVMRLKAEYLYSRKEYNKISFTLTNGFEMAYSKWMDGYRLAVDGNKTSWVLKKQPSNSYEDFLDYLDRVFTFAGTLSLSKSLKSRPINEIQIGDVFIQGGSPGHAVIVVDMAKNSKGEKIFILAQSYMPAQETQILKNPNDTNSSPWYTLPTSTLETPEWDFNATDLKTW
jgi:Domain of unknown function (4846)